MGMNPEHPEGYFVLFQILCIHLKRFRHELMFSTKISTHVSFPLDGLDLQPFLAKDSSAQTTTYDLLSVICHHGTASSKSHLPQKRPINPKIINMGINPDEGFLL